MADVRTSELDARTRELMAEMSEVVPGWRVAFKDDPPASVPALHRALHALGRAFVPEYATRFTTVVGRVVYLPAGARAAWENHPGAWYATLRHELVHLRDLGRCPLWMPLSYALVAPMGWTARSWWELRGYAESMRVRRELGEALDATYVESLVELFSGRSYVFMLWPPGLARALLQRLAGEVARGRFDDDPHGDPSLVPWSDWWAPALAWAAGRVDRSRAPSI